ncbi:MAG TPA: hypothetical protein VFZ78_05705 [Flavisolibacter sp.]
MADNSRRQGNIPEENQRSSENRGLGRHQQGQQGQQVPQDQTVSTENTGTERGGLNRSYGQQEKQSGNLGRNRQENMTP